MSPDPASNPAPSRDPTLERSLRAAAWSVGALLVLSGIGLSWHYVPSVALAWDSLRALEQHVPGGALVRSLHVHGSSAAIAVLLALVVAQTWRADWRGPRLPRWYWTLAALALTIGLGLTGELLPWTRQAVEATGVRTAIAGTAPGGGAIADAFVGAERVSGPTLTRFYALHVSVLPLALAGLVAWHLRLRRVERATRPTAPRGRASIPLAAAAAGALLLVRAATARAGLGAVHVAGDPFEPTPEWHFLWLNALIESSPPAVEPLAALGAPALLVATAVLVPWLDRPGRLRTLWRVALVVVLGTLTGLSVLSAREDRANTERPIYPLATSADLREGYRILRRERCLDCHQLDGTGEQRFDAPPFERFDPEMPLDEFAEIVRNPGAALGILDMPSYGHLDDLELRKLGLFVRSIQAPPD